MLIRIHLKHHQFPGSSLGQITNYGMHHLTGRTGGRKKINENWQRRLLYKGICLLWSGFNHSAGLGKRPFTPAADDLFSCRIHRIIVGAAAHRAAHFHLICQRILLLDVYGSCLKLYTSCVQLVYCLRNFSVFVMIHRLFPGSISKIMILDRMASSSALLTAFRTITEIEMLTYSLDWRRLTR